MDHRDLLNRLLPDDDPDDLQVRQGQFHIVVMGADHGVACWRAPIEEAAA